MSEANLSPHIDQYKALIASKAVRAEAAGLTDVPDLHAKLKPHQRHSTEFALRQGRAALFLDTGLGKSFCALEWGRVIVEKTNRPVLMFAPLAVASQHQDEAAKFGLEAKAIREPSEIGGAMVYVTNYDRAHKFDPHAFGGVILDESSILKSLNGKQSRALRQDWSIPRYRLACTATPAPNDHMELGQHSDFLGWMTQTEMLTRWFLHDSADTGTWRMKGHAADDFWRWVSGWARCVSKPSDLGFSDDGYVLPNLIEHKHVVDADRSVDAGTEKDGQARLFRMPDTSATAIHGEKRRTAGARADVIAERVMSEPGEPHIIWVDTDYDAAAIKARLPDAIEVSGSMSPDEKEEKLVAFSSGRERWLVTKPSIAGYGLNWQHCARMSFVGLSFSYEAYYQAVRRCWRFGQTRDVHVNIAMADTEKSIFDVVSRKAGDHQAMKDAMAKAMSKYALHQERSVKYQPEKNRSLPQWMK